MCVHRGLSGSSGVAGVRPGGRRVHPGSLGSLECALVVRFIHGHCFHSFWVTILAMRELFSFHDVLVMWYPYIVSGVV